ncbi:citryl-CoA lyase [bacterium]|nr:citryl-CoA lyase [bacterium]
MGELQWKTGITKIEPNKIMVRGYPINDLMGKITFSQAIYLILKGELPDDKVGKMMDIILTASIDHGATPPSTLAAITSAATGAPMNASLAAGILTINKYHGGAVEGMMKLLIDLVEKIEKENLNFEDAVLDFVKDKKEKHERIPGIGHRYHTNDPRTDKLFQYAEELGFSGKHVKALKSIQKKFNEISGKNLPINVDGAIGAVLCEMGFPTALGNMFFIMARVPGMIAHIYEEQTTQKPNRKIHPTDHIYIGPEERHL